MTAPLFLSPLSAERRKGLHCTAAAADADGADPNYIEEKQRRPPGSGKANPMGRQPMCERRGVR